MMTTTFRDSGVLCSDKGLSWEKFKCMKKYRHYVC